MNTLLVAIFLSALSGTEVEAQIINAASCSATDVQTAFNAVTASTTTVNIPFGTCDWTTQVKLTVPSSSTTLTIQGTTTITGNCSPSSSTCTASDETVIVDNYASTNALLSITTQSGCTLTRLTGLTFQSGTGSVKQVGMVAIGGSCHSFRLDHNHFNFTSSSLSNIGVRYSNWVYGVTDHNRFDMSTCCTNEPINVWGDTYNGDSLGDGAWADNTNLGSPNFMFIENNTGNNGLYFDDCDNSGREVIRYNVLNNEELQTHPTGSAPNAIRGCRAKETYQNQFNGLSTCNGSSGFNNCLYNMFFLSSGTGVIWGNTAPIINASAGSGYQWLFSIQSMRSTNATYPQTAPPNGWGYCGTAQNGSGSNWDQNTTASTGYACIDQPGRGKSDLLSGDFPSTVNTTTGGIAWPHQALEPYYEWLDSLTPVPNNPGGTFTNSSSTTLTQNRDFYTYTSSFTGATGVGSGTLPTRPSTCTPLVAYWATDTNTLYQCANTNTWKAYYMPYTYPHPLTQGSVGATPATPTNLVITVQ